MRPVKLKNVKIVFGGNRNYIPVKKALIDAGVLDNDTEYNITIEEVSK